MIIGKRGSTLDFKRNISDLKRLKYITTVFFEEGLGYYVNRVKLRSHLPFTKRLQPTLPVNDKEKQAIRLRRAFERLGPTFIKLGQLLSVRPDLVPLEYTKELEKLQDSVAPFSFSQVKKIIEADLGKPLKILFRKFEEKPLASASIAQVHKAVLLSGKVVAVKVQRPNIIQKIDADLDILFFIAHSLEKYFRNLRNYHPVEVVKEFSVWTRKELNFEIEGKSAQHLREEMNNNSGVVVPKIYPSLSTKRVLTLEFVDGVKINDFKQLKKLGINRKKLAVNYFTSILEQALIYGFFHADPHPANIFVQKNGKLVFFDFGIMGELSQNDRKQVVDFIISVSENDVDKSLDRIISLARDTKNADLNGFKQEILPILREVHSHTASEISPGKALYEIIGKGARFNVIFDPNHILMAKAMYQADGFGTKLDPNFKVAEGLEIFAKKYLQKNYSPLKTLKKIKNTLYKHKELILDLPEHIIKIMKKMEKMEKPEHCEAEHLDELEKEWEYLEKRRSFSNIIAGLFISAAIIISFSINYFWMGPVLFTVGLLVLLYFFISARRDLK